jgi:hypothetical protein
MNEIHENGIKIYQFPDSEGDEEEAAANKKLRVSSLSSLSLSPLSNFFFFVFFFAETSGHLWNMKVSFIQILRGH